jgi:hypothetical protein
MCVASRVHVLQRLFGNVSNTPLKPTEGLNGAPGVRLGRATELLVIIRA